MVTDAYNNPMEEEDRVQDELVALEMGIIEQSELSPKGVNNLKESFARKAKELELAEARGCEFGVEAS